MPFSPLFRESLLEEPSAIRNYGSSSSSTTSDVPPIFDGPADDTLMSHSDESFLKDGSEAPFADEDLSVNVQSPNMAGYEEFFGGTMACPTCDGRGRISRDSENRLMALIPVSDKRLRPRRTWLYVGIAIGLCVVLASLLLFFLYPRSVTMSSNLAHIVPDAVFINTSQENPLLILTVTNKFNLTNDNFVPLTATSLELNALFDQHIIGTVSEEAEYYVHPRSSREHSVHMNLTFRNEEGYIAFYCGSKKTHGHSLLIPFDTTAKYSYMGHKEEVTLNTFQHVRCTKEISDT